METGNADILSRGNQSFRDTQRTTPLAIKSFSFHGGLVSFLTCPGLLGPLCAQNSQEKQSVQLLCLEIPLFYKAMGHSVNFFLNHTCKKDVDNS